MESVSYQRLDVKIFFIKWKKIEIKWILRLLDQRERAAFFAISLRRLEERELALALPPLSPPNRPKATAAGFLAAFCSTTYVI